MGAMVRSSVLLVAAVHVAAAAAAAEWDADLHLHPQSTVEKFDVRTTPGRTGSMHRTGHWSTHAAACRPGRCCEPHHPCTLRAAHPGELGIIRCRHSEWNKEGQEEFSAERMKGWLQPTRASGDFYMNMV